ncbi:MAG: hypothetical protein HYV63_05125 [Candidatus Schekmanbacteria bacterium]|nr:hypothetical protein [Candidatus Schekmanbacteria bacterium]
MERVQVQRDFPPEIAEKLETIDERKLATLLGIADEPSRSRWARMVQRIESDSSLKDPAFQVTWRQMKEDMRRWSSDTEFQHDHES